MDIPKPDFVYRLATAKEWRQAQVEGSVPLRKIDQHDGYLHLSTRDQVLETARLHFAGEDELLALEIPFAPLADNIRFELAPKRGEMFPHLYCPLMASNVARAIALVKSGDGFTFGEAV